MPRRPTRNPAAQAATDRPAAGNADRRDDVNSAPSMAELARRLAERTARQQAVDPAAAAATRRAALEAYDLARERRLIVALSAVLALTVGAAVAYFVSTIESRPLVAAAKRCRAAGPSRRRPARLQMPRWPLFFLTLRPHQQRVTATKRRRRRRARGNAGAACGRQPTGACRGDAGRVPAAKQRRQGDPGKTAVLWLQSRTGRRNRRAPDRSGRHALPAGERPGADRRDRPSTAGAASPGSRSPGCPASRPAWPEARRAREPLVLDRGAPTRSSPCGLRAIASANGWIPWSADSSVPPAELSATASAVDRSFAIVVDPGGIHAASHTTLPSLPRCPSPRQPVETGRSTGR